MKGSCKGTAPWRVVHMSKCNLGLPDPPGVDVNAGSVRTWNRVSRVASLADTIGPGPPDIRTALEWPSLITEGSHHFTVAFQGLCFPLVP